MLTAGSWAFLMSINSGWVLQGKRAGSGLLPSALPYGPLMFSYSHCPEMHHHPHLPTDDSLPWNPFHKEILELIVGKSTGESSICKMGIRHQLSQLL